jgi:thiol-disulfide isomerase/thioredoxin
MRKAGLALLAVSIAFAAEPSFISQVKTAAQAGDFTAAKALLKQYWSAQGSTPEYIEAYSWIGRGELGKHMLPEAEQNAAEVRKLSEIQLAKRKLDAEPHLPTALGASIEVQAQALAADGQRDQAVLYLKDELKKWQGTSIVMRLQKNLNLLTMEGKPMPELSTAVGVGSAKPQPLSAHKGHPVLIFLWAHWCGDCKNEVAIVHQLLTNYGPRGLVVVAPTQHYGYVAGGADATPAVETKYINDVFAKFYAPLGNVEAPLSEDNFRKMGVSTTPTMVLVDGKGIVQLYNPGAVSYEQLASKIEHLL